MLQRLLSSLMIGAVGLYAGIASANGIPAAINLDGMFSLGANADIFNATTIPHATVQGTIINGDVQVDWYSFTGAAGATFYADHDRGGVITGPALVNSTLSLFSPSGQLLAFDATSGLPDPGSSGASSGFNAFLGVYTLPSNDTYYLALSSFPNFPTALDGCTGNVGLIRPDGWDGGDIMTGCGGGDFSFVGGGWEEGPYTLNVSLSSVPEPATIALFGIGLAGLGLSRRRKRIE